MVRLLSYFVSGNSTILCIQCYENLSSSCYENSTYMEYLIDENQSLVNRIHMYFWLMYMKINIYPPPKLGRINLYCHKSCSYHGVRGM